MAKIELKDNSKFVLDKLSGNIKTSLTAMGTEAVGMIVDNMQNGYWRPIWKTGDLQRDVSYEVERSGENTVDVGNTLEYAGFVHDGTRKMAARPYIRDALMDKDNRERLQEVAAAYLKTGFD